jgi:two-component system LytT family sensor kinase
MNIISNLNPPKNPPRFWTQAVFWLIFFAFGFHNKPMNWDFWPSLAWALGNTVIFFIAVNINLYILLPKFMFRQSFLSYLAVLLALSLLLTPFITMFNIWLASLQSDSPQWMSLPHFHFVNLLIVTALSSLVRIPLDWLKMQTEKNELLTRNIETELQSLKNQINPHFLFNTLNNLYALTLKKSDKAPEVVLKLSDMMRYMLYECNEKEVLMEKEFRYIRNYIELEKLRYSSNTDIKLNVDETLFEKRIAPLLLIPFVENSFKHGSQSSIEHAYIHINAKLENDALIFSVINSKPQMIPGQLHQSKPGGVGLVNVYKRLELIYPERHTLKIEDMPDSYSIHLNILLNSTKHDKNTDH